MPDVLKSRFQELYPLHECPLCKLEHSRIPHISITHVVDGKEEKVTFAPFELVGTVEGTTHPGRSQPGMDTPAHIYALLWGPPGASQPADQSILYMN
jgi:hypothetical protein